MVDFANRLQEEEALAAARRLNMPLRAAAPILMTTAPWWPG